MAESACYKYTYVYHIYSLKEIYRILINVILSIIYINF